MLEYEWGNPSTMMLSGDEASHQEADHHRQIYDHYSTAAPQPFNDNLNLLPHPNSTAAAAAAAVALFHHQTPTHHHPTHNPFYDPRSYAASSPYAANPHPSLLSLDPTPSPAAAGAGAGGGSAHSYFLVPKTEEVSRASDFTARIGLNLGGRTYFSSADDDFVNRLYRRSRPFDAGTANAPRCQAEGCNADLTHSKHYHRRHKVCEFHSKASTVIAAGLTQRFCQQCSRFHLLSEFDNGKRSCRRRLADHNRRRRKSSQTNQENHKSSLAENTCNSSSDQNLARSPPDSGAPSSSSVTVAISPPRMSLDCFKQRSSPYHSTAAASSASSSSLFFSSG